MDRLQITFPIEGWSYLIEGSITEQNTAFVFVMVPCHDECPFINDCIDRPNCPYNNPQMERKLLDRYEDRMVRALKAAAEELGIDIKMGGD